MKRLSKKTYILVLILIVLLIYFIGIYNYRRPITIHKIFNEAIAIKPNSKEILKKTTIEINAKLYRGLYRGSILDFNAHFVNKLEGTIIIDNKEYSFYGMTPKSKLNDILGTVGENNQSKSDVFLIRMYDLDSILLTSMGKNMSYYRIAAPAQTLEEYIHIEGKIDNIKR